MENILITAYSEELKAESAASRKCLERIPDKLYQYKPHEKSMQLGYLALLVAEIPKWIWLMITDSVIDFATYKNFELSTTKALLEHYESNLRGATDALSNFTEEQLKTDFELKNNGQLLYGSPKLKAISETLNHWVHHRGQLTVYMRMNDIAVPSIYGPSADEKTF
ncbi:DinB family protein [Flavitalea sp.]|nr:DinB family protein [Flavitalea sp.]